MLRLKLQIPVVSIYICRQVFLSCFDMVIFVMVFFLVLNFIQSLGDGSSNTFLVKFCIKICVHSVQLFLVLIYISFAVNYNNFV